MLFRQFQVFLAHVFFFLIGKSTLADPGGGEFPNFFFFETFPNDSCHFLTFVDFNLNKVSQLFITFISDKHGM